MAANQRVTYVEIEFAVTDSSTPKARVTHTELEFAATDTTTPKARVTHAEMEFLSTANRSDMRATYVELEWAVHIIVVALRSRAYLLD
jgi:hypothetical protein